MYKKIRKSFADTVATLEQPEQFSWNKWLREPQIYLERFPRPRINIQSFDNFSAFVQPSLFQVSKFRLTKSRISQDIRSIIIKKGKTFKVFFNFPKTYHQQIVIFESNVSRTIFYSFIFYKDNELFITVKSDTAEQTKSLSPKIISNKIDKIKTKVASHKIKFDKTKHTALEYLIPKPAEFGYEIKIPFTSSQESTKNINILRPKTQKKYLALSFNKLEKKPAVKKINVIQLSEIKDQIEKSSIKRVLDYSPAKLDAIPKHYRVRFSFLERVRVPLFHLKNLQMKVVNQSLIEISLLDKVELNVKNLCPNFSPKTRIINPGISIQLEPPAKETPKQKAKKSKRSNANKKNEKLHAEAAVQTDIESQFPDSAQYQIDGIKFLLSNRTALLCDEIGVDNKDQVISALSYALKAGTIQKALIVAPEYNLGKEELSELAPNAVGWGNQICFNAPEMISTAKRIDKALMNNGLDNFSIFISSYKTFYDLLNDPSSFDALDKIDCIIFDEAQYLLNNEVQNGSTINFPNAKYKWLLSSLPLQILEDRILPEMKHHINDFDSPDGTLARTKHELGNNIPHVIRNDYWLDLDKEQTQEFENTMLQGKKRVIDLIQGGNPFIIQSNIFTLVHQIKQIENFSTHKDSSLKSILLLDQLESIIASGQKTIIFSQYDKQGIQKIEKLLKNNQIKYVLYQSGMPLKELENSANSFRKDSKISVMLAGLTAASIKVKIPEASYLIHFDQWWNPITQWQYEDKSFGGNEYTQVNESVNVINYFGINPVEIKIRETLIKKGLLVKNLFEFLSNETMYGLISNEDWLEILGIEETEIAKEDKIDESSILDEFSSTSLEEIGQRTKAFFTKVGYKNLAIKPDMLHEELIILGTAQKGLNEIKTVILCLPFKTSNIEPVENFVGNFSKNNHRLFVICSSEVSEQADEKLRRKIVFINTEMFAKYLIQFKLY